MARKKTILYTSYAVSGKPMPLLQNFAQLEVLPEAQQKEYFRQLCFLFTTHIGRSEQLLSHRLYSNPHIAEHVRNADIASDLETTTKALAAFDWDKAPLNAFLFSMLSTLSVTQEHPALQAIHLEAQKVKDAFLPKEPNVAQDALEPTSESPWIAWPNPHPLLSAWYEYIHSTPILSDLKILSLEQRIARSRIKKDPKLNKIPDLKTALGFLSVLGLSLHDHIKTTYQLPAFETKSLLEYTKNKLLTIQKTNKDWTPSSIDIFVPLILCAKAGVPVQDLFSRKLHPIQIALAGKATETLYEDDLVTLFKECSAHAWWDRYDGTHPAALLIDKCTHLGALPTHLKTLQEEGFDLYLHYKHKELKLIVGGGHALNKWLRAAPYSCVLNLNTYKKIPYSKFYNPHVQCPPTHSIDAQPPIKTERTDRYFMEVFDLLLNGACPLQPQLQHCATQEGHLLRITNQAIKQCHAQGESHVSKPTLELIFTKLLEQGLDVSTLLPKKDILDQAASPAIRQLVDSHIQKLDLLQALDQKHLQRALQIAQHLAQKEAKRKEQKMPPPSKRL